MDYGEYNGAIYRDYGKEDGNCYSGLGGLGIIENEGKLGYNIGFRV